MKSSLDVEELTESLIGVALKLQELVSVIRNAETLEEVKRFVGPSEEEKEASRRRINRINILRKTHGLAFSSWPMDAINEFTALDSEQVMFEQMYT
jgi:hypothetical protein